MATCPRIDWGQWLGAFEMARDGRSEACPNRFNLRMTCRRKARIYSSTTATGRGLEGAMTSIIDRNLDYRLGATLAGFIATLLLAAIIGWATFGSSPTFFVAQAEHSKI